MIVSKLLVILCLSLTAVTLEENRGDSSNTITGKLMSLCLVKYIMYMLEKEDFKANLLHLA